MKYARTILAICIITLILLSFSGCAPKESNNDRFFADTSVTVKPDFLKKMCDSLYQEYGLSLPENAVILAGAFEYPYAILSFKIDSLKDSDETALRTLLFTHPDDYSAKESADPPDFIKKYGEYTHQFTAKNSATGTLYYSVSDDGTAHFCFLGHHSEKSLV